MPFDDTQQNYIDLREIISQRTKRFVAWTGSGLSADALLPTWPQLRDKLTQTLESRKNLLDIAGKGDIDCVLKRLRTQENHWDAFESLKVGLGDTTFVAEIRRHIRPRTDEVPSIYERLWKLRFSGCLTLNLDRLQARAYANVVKGGIAAEFDGKYAGEYLHLLHGAEPFIANLHGVADNANSWIFTRTDLTSLYRNIGYTQFLNTCITSRTVVFLGISADDVAAGGHLERLVNSGLSIGEHFWITSRNDLQTAKHAEAVGLRLIYYNSPNNDHSELNDIFDDLAVHSADDIAAPAVVPTISDNSIDFLPDPDQIEALPSVNIRNLLNHHAKQVLSSGKANASELYAEFLNKYESAIHRAWYLKTAPPNNDLLGIKLIAKGARGGFGRIYSAEGRNGESLAVKVLHQEIRDLPGALDSFRRGVKAMQILSKHNIKRMVPYKEAYEIPACAVMDYIDGPNIREAVESHMLGNWNDIIDFGCQLSDVVNQAHALPEKVLHRDIRPSNIMLRDFYTTSIVDVVVLDFDLSWHNDALGVSIENPNSSSGFIAPEQVDRSSKYSTRNALVDSFGFGMTMFFTRTRRDPVFGQPRHSDWRDTLTEMCQTYKCDTWHSLPRRFARIIECSTKYDQNERWDMSQICGELRRLQLALSSSASIQSSELLAEELASRCDLGGGYVWVKEDFSATFTSPAGITVGIRGNESQREVELHVAWINSYSDSFRNIRKYLPKAMDQAESKLKSAGWVITRKNSGDKGADLQAKIESKKLSRDLDSSAKSLIDVYGFFCFN